MSKRSWEELNKGTSQWGLGWERLSGSQNCRSWQLCGFGQPISPQKRGGVKGHALAESLALGSLCLGISGSFWISALKGYVSEISFGLVSCTCGCLVNLDNFWNSSSVLSRGLLLVLVHSPLKALHAGSPALTYCCISASFSNCSSPG